MERVHIQSTEILHRLVFSQSFFGRDTMRHRVFIYHLHGTAHRPRTFRQPHQHGRSNPHKSRWSYERPRVFIVSAASLIITIFYVMDENHQCTVAISLTKSITCANSTTTNESPRTRVQIATPRRLFFRIVRPYFTSRSCHRYSFNSFDELRVIKANRGFFFTVSEP